MEQEESVLKPDANPPGDDAAAVALRKKAEILLKKSLRRDKRRRRRKMQQSKKKEKEFWGRVHKRNETELRERFKNAATAQRQSAFEEFSELIQLTRNMAVLRHKIQDASLHHLAKQRAIALAQLNVVGAMRRHKQAQDRSNELFVPKVFAKIEAAKTEMEDRIDGERGAIVGAAAEAMRVKLERQLRRSNRHVDVRLAAIDLCQPEPLYHARNKQRAEETMLAPPPAKPEPRRTRWGRRKKQAPDKPAVDPGEAAALAVAVPAGVAVPVVPFRPRSAAHAAQLLKAHNGKIAAERVALRQAALRRRRMAETRAFYAVCKESREARLTEGQKREAAARIEERATREEAARRDAQAQIDAGNEARRVALLEGMASQYRAKIPTAMRKMAQKMYRLHKDDLMQRYIGAVTAFERTHPGQDEGVFQEYKTSVALGIVKHELDLPAETEERFLVPSEYEPFLALQALPAKSRGNYLEVLPKKLWRVGDAAEMAELAAEVLVTESDRTGMCKAVASEQREGVEAFYARILCGDGDRRIAREKLVQKQTRRRESQMPLAIANARASIDGESVAESLPPAKEIPPLPPVAEAAEAEIGGGAAGPEEAAPTPVASEEAAPTPVASEEASPTPVASEEAAPTPVASEEAAPTPVASEEASASVGAGAVAEAPAAPEGAIDTEAPTVALGVSAAAETGAAKASSAVADVTEPIEAPAPSAQTDARPASAAVAQLGPAAFPEVALPAVAAEPAAAGPASKPEEVKAILEPEPTATTIVAEAPAAEVGEAAGPDAAPAAPRAAHGAAAELPVAGAAPGEESAAAQDGTGAAAIDTASVPAGPAAADRAPPSGDEPARPPPEPPRRPQTPEELAAARARLVREAAEAKEAERLRKQAEKAQIRRAAQVKKEEDRQRRAEEKRAREAAAEAARDRRAVAKLAMSPERKAAASPGKPKGAVILNPLSARNVRKPNLARRNWQLAARAIAQASALGAGAGSAEDAQAEMTRQKLLAGAVFRKHGNRGSPHPRKVFLSEDLERFVWRDPKGTKIRDYMDAHKVTEVQLGQHTAIFDRRSGRPGREGMSLSLIAADRTLDLEVYGAIWRL